MARIPNRTEAAIPGTALLTKALDVVDLIASSNDRLKMRDIIEATQHTKPTLYRIISALIQRGMIEQDPRDHAYSLGPHFTELASMVARNTELISLAALPLAGLASRHGERVNLGALDGDALRTIASWDGFGETLSTNVGGRKPIYCTALGKVLLAFQPRALRDTIIRDLVFEMHTPKTHPDLDSLRTDLDAVRMRGFAVDDEEIIEGWRCVSLPILDRDGHAAAAVSVTAPEFRMAPARLHQIAADLRAAATAISGKLPDRTVRRASPFVIPGDTDEITADPGRYFDPSAILDRQGSGYIVADRMGARLLDVSDSGTGVLCQTKAPIEDAALHDGVLFILSGGMIYRVDANASAQEPRLLCRPQVMDPEAIAISTDGQLLLGAGTAVYGLEADGSLSQHASDRRPATSFGILHGVAAYVGGSGLTTIDGARHIRVPDGTRSFVQAGRTVFAIGAADWMLNRLDAETGEQLKAVSLPVPKPTTLSWDAENGCLLVGTERIGLSEALVELAPQSGRVLRVKVDQNKVTREKK